MAKAVIALGTNIGDKKQNIADAYDALALLPDTFVTKTSRIYKTKPVGYAEQDDFFNSVAEIETGLSPHALLGACLGIEAAMGRKRLFKNGPRIIDLDILLYEGFTENTDELTVPHPRMTERAFVLQPLCDIYKTGTALGFDFNSYLRALTVFDLAPCAD